MVKKEEYIGLGIDQDTAPDKRKTDTFWDSENISIVNNGRSLSIKPILGETSVLTFPLISDTDQVHVVGYVTYMDNIYVFTTTTNNYAQLHKITKAGVRTVVAYGDWNLSTSYRIDALINYETDTIIKIYWIDGINTLRSLNIASTVGHVTGDSLNNVTSVTLRSPDITVEVGGNLIAGNIQYVYNYYQLNGVQSNLSSASSITSIATYFKGFTTGSTTNLRTKIELTEVDTSYYGIRVYSIHYQELNQSPKITLIYDVAIQGNTSITLYDDGNLFIASLSISDLLGLTFSPITPNTLTVKRSRLFLGNYTESNFNPNVDMRAYSYIYNDNNLHLKDAEGNITSYGNTFPSDLTLDAINPDYGTYKYQINSTSILGGSGPNVKYTFHYTAAYDNYIPPKSLKQGEIYRVGIRLYNKYGQGSPVKWMADIKIPRKTDGSVGGYGNLAWSTGLQVTLVSTTALTNAGVTGYQVCIVERTPADRTILSQGFIVPALRFYKDGTPIDSKYYPYYITKDLVPFAISNATPTTTEQKNNAGGDISIAWRNGIDFYQDIGTHPYPYLDLSTVFFYSSDTMFESSVILPDKVRVLGSAVSTLATSGMNAPAEYGDNTLVFRQPYTPYSTEFGTGYYGDHPFGSPNCVLGRSAKSTSNPVLYVFEAVFSKKYDKIETINTEKLVTIVDTQFLPKGSTKVINSSIVASNSANFPDLLPEFAGLISTSYYSTFDSSVVLHFSSINWNNSESTYYFSDFDATNMYGQETGRALPMVELIRTVETQYGGNSYEVKQRNVYLDSGKIHAITTGDTLAYIGDVYIGKLSVNRCDGGDIKLKGTQNIYEYVNLPYMENNHNVTARADNMYDWSINLPSTVSYNYYRIADNHSLASSYNQKETLFKGYAQPFNFSITDKFPLSVIGSNVKSPNELFDSWLVFNPNNTKLLEGQYGNITKLHNLNGEILVIQSTGIAVLAVEPRIQTQGSDGVQVSLGIGSLFYDHRYISTNSGSDNKWAICEDGKDLYYYDNNLNIIFSLHGGKLSTIKTVKNILDSYPTGPHTATFSNSEAKLYFQYNNFTLVYDLLLEKFISKHTYLNSNKWLIVNDTVLYQIDDSGESTILYTQGTGNPKSSTITYLLCPDSTMEKTFHNLEYRLKDSDFTDIEVYNDRSNSGVVVPDTQIKFDIHRLHLPRVQNSRERWRGIYIFVKLYNTSAYSLDNLVLMYNIKG